MNRKLLEKATRDLCIDRVPDEADEDWSRRVRYSVIGLQMLASLYDKNDDEVVESDSSDVHDDPTPDTTVSMRRILRRGERLAEIFGMDNFDVEKVRKLYIRNGFMLHKNHRLAYPVTTFAEAGNMLLARGVPPWKTAKVSGLGMLTQWKTCLASLSVEDMFNIEQSTTSDWFQKFIRTITWKTESLPTDIEWLNIHESPKHGYWSGKPSTEGFSLCRTRNEMGREYIFWQASKGVLQLCRLPEWRVKNGEYRRIAIALRSLHDNIPTVTIKKQSRTLSIEFDYLLPPTEQRFVELYSWSTSEDPWELPGQLKRIFAIDLYAVVRTIFERLSFKIQEIQ